MEQCGIFIRFGRLIFRCIPKCATWFGIWDGVARSTLSGMMHAIAEQTGTPQKPVRWDNPDSWIKRRLSGDHADLALRIWRESEKTVNPRYVYGSSLFINAYHLLEPNVFDCFQLSAKGKAFLDNDPRVLREMDQAEGLPRLLGILAGKNAARRGDLLPEWNDFLREYSSFASPATIQETLRRRLINLMERGYVVRDGLAYTITRKGLDYADQFTQGRVDRQREVIRSITAFNHAQKEQLFHAVATMPANRFETLVSGLLEGMGYEDIVIKGEGVGKGLEMTAMVPLGISSVNEVILVKRQQTRVGRKDLDRLRGIMARQEAVRGTLVATDRFTRKCREAAVAAGTAPVALIDGDRLFELLVEQRLGVKEVPASLFTIDEEYFGISAKKPGAG